MKLSEIKKIEMLQFLKFEQHPTQDAKYSTFYICIDNKQIKKAKNYAALKKLIIQSFKKSMSIGDTQIIIK